MQKILIYTENYEYGGGGNKYLIDILNNIPVNFEVVLYSNKNGINKYELEKISRNYIYKDIQIFTIPNIVNYLKNKNWFLFFAFKIFIKFFKFILILFFKYKNSVIFSKILKLENPDLIIICNGGYPGGFSCLDLIYVAKTFNIKSIFSVVSTPFISKLLHFFYPNIKKNISTLIVNAEFIKRVFVDKLNFEERKISILYNTINAENFCEDKMNFNFLEFGKKYNIDFQNKVILGYTGRIEKFKGIYVLLDAFKIVNMKNSKTFLILVGTGEDIENAKLYAKKLNISSSILFTGFFYGDIRNILTNFDIFLFPSFWEGLPYSILEAMSLGKIIITTNVGGIPEIINEKSGIFVPSKNSKIMADKMLEVLVDLDKYKYLGENAKKIFDEKISYSIFRKNLLNILEN